LGAKL